MSSSPDERIAAQARLVSFTLDALRWDRNRMTHEQRQASLDNHISNWWKRTYGR